MKNTRPLPNLEKDYLVFLWFLTLTTVGFYIYILLMTPGILWNPLNVMISSLLIIIYIILHWFTMKIYPHPRLLAGYIMLQGVLSFAIVLLTRVEVMIFALFLALIGEAIGMLGLTRRGMLACAYYLALSLASFAILKGPGDIFWWLLGTIPTVLFVVIYVTLYSRQAEANERARELLAELETANQQLSAYAAQVEDLTIAAERQRMARELHDTLSQGLAGLILQLEAADAHLAQERPEKARQIIQQTMNRARETLGEARSAIDNLRRAAAPTLEDTIRLEIESFGKATGIPCALEIDLHGELAESQCDAIARIVPEALTNIQQHARASMVSIRLLSDGVTGGDKSTGGGQPAGGDKSAGGGRSAGGVRLEIHDDGAGFEPADTPPGHYGLIGMRERARLAGGTLEIESRPGAGTRLTVLFPPGGDQP